MAFPELTAREREVALLLCDGMTNKEIADALDISIKTVDTHRGNLLEKLDARNNVALLRLAIKRGYVRVAVDPPTEAAEAA